MQTISTARRHGLCSLDQRSSTHPHVILSQRPSTDSSIFSAFITYLRTVLVQSAIRRNTLLFTQTSAAILLLLTLPNTDRFSKFFYFYARQHNAIARICHGNSVCLSVRPSHGWISQKRLKLGSRSFHHTVAPSLFLCRISFIEKF